MLKVLLIASALLPLAPLVAKPQPEPRPWDYPSQADSRPLTPREASATYSGCTQVRKLGLAPLRAGQPGYRPWWDGDMDGLACEPVRNRR